MNCASPLRPKNKSLPCWSILGLLTTSALAQDTYNWNGSRSNNDWDQVDNIIGGGGTVSRRSNWTLNGSNSGNTYPAVGDTAHFPNIGGNRAVDINGDRTISTLSVSSANPYTFDTAGDRYSNTLTMTGGIVAGSNTGTHTIWTNFSFVGNTAWNLGGTFVLNGDVIGTGTLSKTGTGTLHLLGDSSNGTSPTFTGTLIHQNGHLIVSATTLSTAQLSLDGGSVSLLGTTPALGSLSASGDVSISADAGAIVALGSTGIVADSSATAFSFDRSLEISGSTFSCEIDAANSDSISVAESLTLGGPLVMSSLSTPTASSYTIASGLSRSGTFSSVTGLPPRYKLVYSPTAVTLQLEPIIRVDASNTNGTQDGLTWATAFSRLQDALAIAMDGDQVWVADGIYYPDEGNSQTNNDRHATFSVGGGVSILGGFDGTETSADQRDPEANLSILSGDLTQNDITNSAGITESADDIRDNNSYSVVTIDYGVDEVFTGETRLDGFTVTAGHCTVVAETATGRGGGLYVASASAGSIPIIERCRFYGNHAYDGGGYFVGNDAYCTFISCDIRGNRADRDGGGGATYNSTILMINSNISGNISDRNGGGILDDLRSSTGTYINCTIAGNYADDRWGGYDSPTGWNRVTMKNVLFWNNLESRGGRSIDPFFASRYSLENCLFEGSDLTSLGTANLNGTLAANDPLFLNRVDVSTMTSPTLSGDYRLSSGSPAINVGNSSFISESEDLAGGPRLVDSTVDLGAYELDKIAPVLVLGGDNPQELEVDDRKRFSEPAGTSASDNEDGDLTDQIVITGSVDMGTAGTYTITYSISDATGNSAQLTRTVNLNDSTAPEIEAPDDILNIEITHPDGNIVSLGTPIVSDNSAAAPTVTNNVSGPFILGTTTVIWTAEDAAGNKITDATQLVQVVDTTDPVFTDAIFDEGFVLPTISVTYTGSDGGNTPVTVSIPSVTDLGDRNPSITRDLTQNSFPLGETLIVWTARDATGNDVVASQTIEVRDTTPPTITAPADITGLEGNTSFGTGNQSGGYSGLDLGSPTGISDNLDTNVEVSNDAPTIFPLGETTVTWRAEDDFGNVTEVSQIVEVEDTVAPILTLRGEAYEIHRAGTPYNDETASFFDICDPDATLARSIIVGPLTDPGVYEIEYNVTDESGNQAIPVTRLVAVVEELQPSLIYVDDLSDFTITSDYGASSFSPGDVVTWNSPNGPVINLIWDYNAFVSLQEAVDAASAEAEVLIGAGTFSETASIDLTQSITIKGSGAGVTTLSGNDTHEVIFIKGQAGDTITIRDLTLSNARYTTLNITTDALSQLFNLEISNNTTDGVGGIYISSSDVVIANSTISGNVSSIIGGGALTAVSSSDVTIINSTISGNRTTRSNLSSAGGIYCKQSSITLRHCTVTQNSGPNSTGGIVERDQSTLTLGNSLIVGNTGSRANDLTGVTITSEGGNFIGEIGSVAGFLESDLTLSSTGTTISEVINTILSDNGGPTRTHALPVGSPALGIAQLAGTPADLSDADEDNDTSEDAPFDQRGEPRTIDGFADAGAFEASVAPDLVSTEFDSVNGELGLRLIFRQSVLSSTENILLQDSSGSGTPPSTLATIPVADTTIIGNSVFVPIPDSIPNGTTIFLLIQSGAFTSLSGVNYSGTSGSSFLLPYDIVYVAPAEGFSPAFPSAGARVTWNNLHYRLDPTETVRNLTFGSNAFDSVQDAIDAVSPGGTIRLAEGSYDEGQTINISKSLTMIGIPDYFVDFDAFDNYRLFSITGDANVIFTDILFFSGAGIEGGTIHHNSSGELSIRNSEITLSQNAIYNGPNGTITLVRSSINRSTDGYALINHGTLRLYNSTIGRNSGGGIQNFGTADVRQATLVNNGTYGINNEIGSSLTIANSALADHTTWDLGGNFTSLGSNFIATTEITADLDASDLDYTSTGTSDSGDIVNYPTAGSIFFISASSPLYNGGNNANIPADIDDADEDLDTTESSPYSQGDYNIPRISDGQVDIGAFELNITPALQSITLSSGNTPLSDMILIFDVPVFPGTGVIELKDEYTNNILASYDVNGSEVSFSGNTITISPSTTLPDGYDFSVHIDSNVIFDGSNSPYIGTQGFWDFQTCPLNVYLNTPDGWGLGTFSSQSNGSTGLEVTWEGGGGNTVPGLSFSFNAFVSIEAAMEAACDGATLHFAPGTWDDKWDPDPVDIDKTVSFSGAGLGQTFIVNNADGDALNIIAPGVVITGITTLDDPYSRWVAVNYPGETDPAIIAFDADPNDTGITNGVAFLTASDPSIFDPNARTALSMNNGILTYVMRHNAEAGVPAIEHSDNLVDWSPGAPSDKLPFIFTWTEDDFGTGVDSLIIEVDSATLFDSNIFIRRKLTAP